MDPTEQDRRDQEQSDDYGYDLAHEVPAADRRPSADPAHRPQHHDTGRRGAAGEQADGDYGYDEAHDV